MKKLCLLFLTSALLIGCASVPKQPEVNLNEIKSSFIHDGILFTTDFIDSNSFSLKTRENQKIDVLNDSAMVYGTTREGGGSLIYPPIPITLGSRIVIMFEPLTNYQFGFHLMEQYQDSDNVNSIMVEQTESSLYVIDIPVAKKDGKMVPQFLNTPWDKAEFRYSINSKYLMVYEISKEGMITATIYNKYGKLNRVNFKKQFRDVPCDLLIRSYSGKAKYTLLEIQKI